MTRFHLARRFFGSVNAKELESDELSWVRDHLLETEFALWLRFGVADRRHSYVVARRVVKLLDEKATRPVVAAALLHDIGKTATQLSTLERVFATLAGSQATFDQKRSWSTENGWLGRAGSYLMHHELGAEMLTEAGSDPLTVAWARDHELIHTEWTLPEEISDALWRADNGR